MSRRGSASNEECSECGGVDEDHDEDCSNDD